MGKTALILGALASGHSIATGFVSPSLPVAGEHRCRCWAEADWHSGSRVRARAPSSVTSLVNMERYDAEAIDAYFRRHPWLVLDRLAKLGPPLLAWGVGAATDTLTSSLVSETEKRRRIERRAAQLRTVLLESESLTLIKAGQKVAQRGDIVGNEVYARELEGLQDATHVFSSDVAMRILEEELGPDTVVNNFELLRPEPIESASIGQVYQARLRRRGDVVSIKVQRPDAIPSVAVDIYLLRRVASLYESVNKGMPSDLLSVVDLFGEQLFKELDYREEARNAMRFRELHGDLEGVYVPRVYPDLCSRRVLVMEWVDGEKGPWAEGGDRMVAVGLKCYVVQLFGTGLLHADPHRGNLIRTTDDKLCWLDFGATAEIPVEQRYALLRLTFGLYNRDVAMLSQSLNELDFLPATTNVNKAAVELARAFSNASDRGGLSKPSKLNAKELGRNIQDAAKAVPLKIPPLLSLVLRTLTVLEGLALKVDADFSVVKGAYPYILQLLLGQAGPRDKAALRGLLRDVLITGDGRIDWIRLGDFLEASSALRSTNFDLYKGALRMSDLRTNLDTSDEEASLTLDLGIRVLRFLLSDEGRFLQTALVNEIVDTVDAVQLASYGLLPVLTGGVLPRPNVEAPDGQRLEGLLRLLEDLVSKQEEEAPAMGEARQEGVVAIRSFLVRLGNKVVNDPNFRRQEMAPLLRQAQPLLNEITARLIEKNLTRFVRTRFDFIKKRQERLGRSRPAASRRLERRSRSSR